MSEVPLLPQESTQRPAPRVAAVDVGGCAEAVRCGLEE